MEAGIGRCCKGEGKAVDLIDVMVARAADVSVSPTTTWMVTRRSACPDVRVVFGRCSPPTQ